MMTCAFGCWIAAATSMGDAKMWLFVGLGALLTLAGLLLMRPAPSGGRVGTHRADSAHGLEQM
jgi:predicted signal transduction protein with EAL and GGDEF domain